MECVVSEDDGDKMLTQAEAIVTQLERKLFLHKQPMMNPQHTDTTGLMCARNVLAIPYAAEVAAQLVSSPSSEYKDKDGGSGGEQEGYQHYLYEDDGYDSDFRDRSNHIRGNVLDMFRSCKIDCNKTFCDGREGSVSPPASSGLHSSGQLSSNSSITSMPGEIQLSTCGTTSLSVPISSYSNNNNNHHRGTIKHASSSNNNKLSILRPVPRTIKARTLSPPSSTHSNSSPTASMHPSLTYSNSPTMASIMYDHYPTTSHNGGDRGHEYAYDTTPAIAAPPTTLDSTGSNGSSNNGQHHHHHQERYHDYVDNLVIDPVLMAFLITNRTCLKVPPPVFHTWLLEQDVVTMEDLREACDDNEFVSDDMRSGGLKAFKKYKFMKAVEQSSHTSSSSPNIDKVVVDTTNTDSTCYASSSSVSNGGSMYTELT